VLFNESKIILDLCGGTGAWSKPYRDAGYDVRIITLPEYDVRSYEPPDNVYGILAAPPCTVFSRAAWKIPKEKKDFKSGMEIVQACLDIIWRIQSNGLPLKFWALENPMGFLYNFLGWPAFIFQGWQMGEMGTGRTKRYAIWGYFKPPTKTVKRRPKDLPPTRQSHSDWYSPKRPQWVNADLPLTRGDIRAITPAGFAQAFFDANP